MHQYGRCQRGGDAGYAAVREPGQQDSQLPSDGAASDSTRRHPVRFYYLLSFLQLGYAVYFRRNQGLASQGSCAQ